MGGGRNSSGLDTCFPQGVASLFQAIFGILNIYKQTKKYSRKELLYEKRSLSQSTHLIIQLGVRAAM
ncbi:unnamed protein product [Moneuplotes crassus]|uniref:Uncharacterized protein n=1 Tax=Euplotes crassus TaxID=5936 RepID=A0AAD1XPT1_EUPCR|nr:unnamed protein product [Moneuplotes crassus]